MSLQKVAVGVLAVLAALAADRMLGVSRLLGGMTAAA